MKQNFATLALMTSAMLAAVFGASGARADVVTHDSKIACMEASYVSTLTHFRLAPALEKFATTDGQVSLDLARQLVKLTLDGQGGRFVVELPIVATETNACGVVTYRGQDGDVSLEIRDRSNEACLRANIGIKRAIVMQAYLTTADQAVSAFEGTAFRVQK